MGDRPPHPAGPGSTPAPRRPSDGAARHVVTEQGELLTQGDVERRIMALSDELDDLTHELDKLAEEDARTEVAYKVKYHQQRTIERATGVGFGPGGRVTNDEAEDHAVEASSEEFLAFRLAEGKLKSARDALKAKQSQIDALRTVAANIRAQT